VLSPAATTAPSPAADVASADLDRLVGLLAGRRLLALTGAGLSTDSGIPDYRGPGSVPRTPMTYAEFRSGPAARQRYWARSHVGWQHLHRADPNGGHLALAALERSGRLTALITQNVDGLHQAAGSRQVVDLHGRISSVVCLDCRDLSSRERLHQRLDAANAGFGQGVSPGIAPDGDAVVGDVDTFEVVPCEACGGVLKPGVVFFGENVPRERVDLCYALVEEAEALLVAGSSLTVMSGLRFVRAAHRRGIPVAIVNRGPTRGDDLASLRVDDGCSPVLAALSTALSTGSAWGARRRVRS
jgi:NAD-dependent SIR2 family protein deacetylase